MSPSSPTKGSSVPDTLFTEELLSKPGRITDRMKSNRWKSQTFSVRTSVGPDYGRPTILAGERTNMMNGYIYHTDLIVRRDGRLSRNLRRDSLRSILLFVLPVLLCVITATTSAQNGPTQRITWSSTGTQTGSVSPDGTELIELVGNVIIQQGDVTINADRANVNVTTQQVTLRGNVRVTQPGTSLSAPQINYNGTTGVAVTPAGVVIRDEEATIDAGYAEYYSNRRFAIFRKGVTLRDDNTTLTAGTGTYDAVQRKGVFDGSVRVRTDSGTLRASHMTYWRATEESYASGNVSLFSDKDSTLLEADILRNRPNVEALALGHVRLHAYRDSTLLTCDTLRNIPDVETFALGNVFLYSQPDASILTGDSLRHFPQNDYTIVTGSPVLISVDSTIAPIIESEASDSTDVAEVPRTDSTRNSGEPYDNPLAYTPPPVYLDTIRQNDSLFTLRRDTTRLTATILERFTTPEKLMVATGNAHIMRREFEGVAGVLRFLQDQELITLGSGADSLVVSADDLIPDSLKTDTLVVNLPPPDPPTSDVTANDGGVIEGRGPVGSEPPQKSNEEEKVPGPPRPSAADSLPHYTTPIVWYQESQLTGDSITVFMVEKKVEQVDVLGNAFAVSTADAPRRYDQIASERLLFNVKNDTIRSVHAQTAAASIYFVFSKSLPDGLNRSSGDTIVILFDNGEASRISMYGPGGRAEGELIPERSVAGNETTYHLSGFSLHRRPGQMKVRAGTEELSETEGGSNQKSESSEGGASATERQDPIDERPDGSSSEDQSPEETESP